MPKHNDFQRRGGLRCLLVVITCDIQEENSHEQSTGQLHHSPEISSTQGRSTAVFTRNNQTSTSTDYSLRFGLLL